MPIGKFCLEMCGGKGCDVTVAVQEPCDSLVDGAGHGEPEVGVLSVAHVRKILVGEGLYDDAGHLRVARLRVVAVEEVAPAPLSILLSKVLLEVVEHGSCQCFRCLPRRSVAKGTASVVVGGTDAQ